MENRVVVGSELDSLKKDLLLHIKSFCNSMSAKDQFLVGNSTATPLCWTDALRFFVDGLRCTNSPAKDLIISSAYQINKRCPFALPLYFYNVIGKEIDHSSSPVRVSSDDLLESLKKTDDEFILDNFDIFEKCLKKAGASGTITVVPSTEEYVKLEKGYKTLCGLDGFFAPYLDSVDMLESKIIALSGAVLEVSEIHHILEKAFSTKQTIVLIASSFSQDVSNTLLVNWQQGNTNVFPFIIEDSIDTINEFRDIAQLTNCFFATTENGLRLSNVKLDDLNNNDLFFNSEKNELRISLDEGATNRCFTLRKKLLQKYDKENVGDVRDVISKRIARMSSRNVTLGIPVETSHRGLVEDKAAAFFSYFSKCAQQGIIKMGQGYTVEYLPFHEASYAVRRAKQDVAAIDKVKALVRSEE